MPLPALIALGVAGVFFVKARRARASTPSVRLPFPLPVEAFDVPFASARRPLWPIADSKNPRKWEVPYYDVNKQPHGNVMRRFGAPRTGTGGVQRRHAGIDLYANAGDVVKAMEPGIIVATQNFLGGTHAILQLTDSGIVVLYGEVEPNSWRSFGVGVGTRVSRGAPIARVGLIQKPDGTTSHMLHIETYRAGVDQNISWRADQPASPELLNPTLYALQAKAATMPMA